MRLTNLCHIQGNPFVNAFKDQERMNTKELDKAMLILPLFWALQVWVNVYGQLKQTDYLSEQIQNRSVCTKNLCLENFLWMF